MPIHPARLVARLVYRPLVAFLLTLSAIAPQASAQGYPMPGVATASPVICTTCPFPYSNLPTWSYGPPLRSFIGRYVDSQLTRDYQRNYGMRTLRAGRVEVVPEHNRVYMIVGSTFASYNMNTFFSPRLGSALSPNSYIVGTYRDGNQAETHLPWDGHVYPEGPDSGWLTVNVDIQHFLYGFDTDDRNLVYLAYSAFGWGIVRNESNASLSFVSQVYDNPDMSPTEILSLKSGSNYYAVVSAGGSVSLIYDVTNPLAPALVRTLSFGVTSWDKTPTHVALVTGGKVRIYTVSGLISGGEALNEFTATAGQFQMVASDGLTSFFAVENHNNSPLRVSVFTFAAGSFSETKRSNGERFIALGIRYGSGHLTVWGYDQTFKNDVRLFRLENLIPTEIGLNSFFRNYYTSPPAGYAKPAGYTDAISDVLVHENAGRKYLFYANHGLGDVYELAASPAPSPTPTPTPTPGPSCSAPPTERQVFITYSGAASGCAPGGLCTQGEAITFSLERFDPAYLFGTCHAFEWDFNGLKKSGRTVQHSFNTGGLHGVSVKVSVNGSSSTVPATVQIRFRRPADFRGSGMSQSVIYRNGAWMNFSAPEGGVWTGQTSPNCIPAPADYDGDGVTEMAMLCNGAWHFFKIDGTYLKGIWTGGVPGDLPAPADYDGDGDDDVVVYRSGAWFIYDFFTGNLVRSVWTGPGPNTIPVPGDYDGDGKAEFSVYAGGPWHFFNADGSYRKGIWTGGDPRDIPVPGDYALDGTDEVVIFRGGAWLFYDFVTRAYVRGVWTGVAPFNGAPLQPAPLDVDGDGTVELTVFTGGPWHFFNDNGSYLKGVWTGGVTGDRAISRRQHIRP